MRVDVYFNLHKKLWSVRDHKTRRVIEHRRYVALTDVTFHVSPAGNARVRAERKKHVHAWVTGTLVDPDTALDVAIKTGGESRRFTYNPYAHTTFVDKLDEQPVTSSPFVLMACSRLSGTRHTHYRRV